MQSRNSLGKFKSAVELWLDQAEQKRLRQETRRQRLRAICDNPERYALLRSLVGGEILKDFAACN